MSLSIIRFQFFALWYYLNMAKKTKKEKIIAQYRRRLKLISQLTKNQILVSPEQKNSREKKENNQIKLSDQAEQEANIRTNHQSSHLPLIRFFKEDFKKTSIVSFFIITLEFIIYFVMIKK